MSGAVMNAALPVGCANATGNGEEWQRNRIGGDEMEVVLAGNEQIAASTPSFAPRFGVNNC